MIKDNDGARTHPVTNFFHGIEIHVDIVELSRQKAGGGAARQTGFIVISGFHPSGMLLNDLAQGRPERKLKNAGTIDPPAYAVNLVSRGPFVSAQIPEPLGAVSKDVRHIG